MSYVKCKLAVLWLGLVFLASYAQAAIPDIERMTKEGEEFQIECADGQSDSAPIHALNNSVCGGASLAAGTYTSKNKGNDFITHYQTLAKIEPAIGGGYVVGYQQEVYSPTEDETTFERKSVSRISIDSGYYTYACPTTTKVRIILLGNSSFRVEYHKPIIFLETKIDGKFCVDHGFWERLPFPFTLVP